MGVRAVGGAAGGFWGCGRAWASHPGSGGWVLQQGQGRRRLSTATAEDQTCDFGFLY